MRRRMGLALLAMGLPWWMMARTVVRYIRDANGRVQRRKLRADRLHLYADRIVVGYRKPKRATRSQKRIPKKVPRSKQNLGDYSKVVTGFIANGVCDYNLFPFPLTNGPMKWYSNEGFFLGRVLYPGHIKLPDMLEMLNRTLRYEGARGQPLDFKDICQRWKYKYQLTGIQNGKRVPVGRALVVSGTNATATVRRRAA